MTVDSISGAQASNHYVLEVASGGPYSIDSASKLDLMNNDAIFFGGSLSAVNASLTSGYNGGAWNGNGIASSLASQILDTALGVKQESGSTTFDGQAVNSGDVVVKYTYVGDAVLAGSFGSGAALDYVAIDNGYNENQAYLAQHPGGTALPATGWANGDFNYDGQINGDDYTLLDNAYNSRSTQTATPLSQIAASGTPAVAVASSSVFATGEPVAVSIPGSSVSGSSSAGDGLFNKDKKSVADELFDDDSSAG
jgi:hypothetical protein